MEVASSCEARPGQEGVAGYVAAGRLLFDRNVDAPGEAGDRDGHATVGRGRYLVRVAQRSLAEVERGLSRCSVKVGRRTDSLMAA